MSVDGGMIDRRLLDLETKVAYQEKAIADLSDEIYAQQQRLSQVESLLRLLAPQLRELGLNLDTSPLQKPPHY